MSYILDGIETAMEASEKERAHGFPADVVRCPCGWVSVWETDDDVAATRFHYTHCPKAKKARLPPAE